MSNHASATGSVSIENELEDARRLLADEEMRRELDTHALRRPQGWLQARSWRERQRVRGWLVRKIDSMTSRDGQ